VFWCPGGVNLLLQNAQKVTNALKGIPKKHIADREKNKLGFTAAAGYCIYRYKIHGLPYLQF
jgi:hypothetical protein